MFQPDWIKQDFLAQAQQKMLKGILVVKVKLVIQSIAAVKIPGGLTPP
jgi:hypothetical protein